MCSTNETKKKYTKNAWKLQTISDNWNKSSCKKKSKMRFIVTLLFSCIQKHNEWKNKHERVQFVLHAACQSRCHLFRNDLMRKQKTNKLKIYNKKKYKTGTVYFPSCVHSNRRSFNKSTLLHCFLEPLSYILNFYGKKLENPQPTTIKM